MTAQEFVAYMPPDALVATIVHVWNNFDADDPEATAVIRECWLCLYALYGDEAYDMMAEDVRDYIGDIEVTP